MHFVTPRHRFELQVAFDDGKMLVVLAEQGAGTVVVIERHDAPVEIGAAFGNGRCGFVVEMRWVGDESGQVFGCGVVQAASLVWASTGVPTRLLGWASVIVTGTMSPMAPADVGTMTLCR